MPRLVFAARAAIACAPILALSSCGLFKSVVEAPMNVARAVMPGAPGEKLQPIDTLHPRLMALADNCAQRVAIATELFAEEAKTREAARPRVAGEGRPWTGPGTRSPGRGRMP
jgi:hypothetical protein